MQNDYLFIVILYTARIISINCFVVYVFEHTKTWFGSLETLVKTLIPTEYNLILE